MNKPHKHAEMIKAWADGKTIQYFAPDGAEWVDLSSNGSIGWYEKYEYRIKPKPVVKKWRWVYVNLLSGEANTLYVSLSYFSEKEAIYLNYFGQILIQKVDSTMIEVEE